ncbi:Methyltransferase type 11 [Ignavibacterium album JCM 16511]|uniref:Methyltransferase type 11 n=1 Tax=Ignavibacterium album (strain DSM 19864 / JCM 16511 / NBRC 101810 / Mat9-16) TaxID=945713 RepID=I0AMR5_IGNAJ|nr:Methyltransferase type 11 [Ignavibacterium album JCM 16511]
MLFLSSSEDYEELEFPIIKIPFSLKGFAEYLGHTDLQKSYLDEEDIHLIERDIFWNNDSSDNYEHYLNGFYTCKYFYTELVKKIKPSLVFVWGNLLPQSIIFKEILELNNVPSFFLERGFFNDSLMIEELLYKELNSFAEDRNNFRTITSFQYYNRLKQFYLNNSTSKYPENHDEKLESILQQKKKEGLKLITFYGTHDSIFFPEDQIYARKISTIFKYTAEAARFISEEVNKNPNLILVIKPHPADKNDYSLLESERVFVTKNFFNRSLIEISDLIVVGNSTIQYEVLLSEKPILLIAKSSLYNYDAAYIPQSKKDFTSTLNEALEKSDFELKLNNSKIFFESLLKSHIYFYTEESPGKNLENLIKFIITNANTQTPDSNLSDRLYEFEKNIFIHNQLCNNTENSFRLVQTNHIQNKFHPQLPLLKEQLEKKLFDYYNYLSNNPDIGLIREAETLITENSFIEARALLHRAVEIPIFKTDALNDLAYIEILEENYLQAFNNIITVLQMNPNDEVALSNLSYLVENNKLDNSFVNEQLTKLFRLELQLNKFNSFTEFLEYERTMSSQYQERKKFELKLLPDKPSDFSYTGYCFVCNDVVPFQVDFNYAYQIDGRLIPNWRERLVCPGCGLNNRMRLTYHLIHTLFNDFADAAVYITEQMTRFYQLLKKINPDIIGSEFLGETIPLGSVNHSGIRNENFTKLTFENEKFDYLISLEVLEHIPDYKQALRESFRVLKPKGKLLFTVPFNKNSDTNIVRAKVDEDGSIIHLLPPEYHGDPVKKDESCLCYYHFGWEILDELKKTGFKDAYAFTTYSQEYGYLGGEQIFFIAEKGN